MRLIEGIIVPLLTPIDRKERPDLGQLRTLTEYVIAGGVAAIFANGTTGEFARFTAGERQAVLDTIVKTAAARVPVLAGVSDCGTRLVMEHIRAAEAAGADAVVTTLPYYFPTSSPREQADFIADAAGATRLPLLLYNLPAAVGRSIAYEALDAVCAIDNLYGIKDTSGQTEYVDRLLQQYGSRLKIFVGDERLTYYGLSHGAAGVVPSLANPFPKVLAAAWQAAKAQDWESCKRHCGVVDRMNILNGFCDSWMSPNIWRKVALAQLGVMDETFTRPFQPVGEADRETIAQYIRFYQEQYNT